MIISVIGSKNPNVATASLAEQVGEELAKLSITLVCGGKAGVMEAACKWAESKGGTTIDILPGQDKFDANPWVDIPIHSGLPNASNIIVVRTGQAVIAIAGRYGTISEIGPNTWKLMEDTVKDTGIIVAKNAKDAASKAIKAAEGQFNTNRHTG